MTLDPTDLDEDFIPEEQPWSLPPAFEASLLATMDWTTAAGTCSAHTINGHDPTFTTPMQLDIEPILLASTSSHELSTVASDTVDGRYLNVEELFGFQDSRLLMQIDQMTEHQSTSTNRSSAYIDAMDTPDILDEHSDLRGIAPRSHAGQSALLTAGQQPGEFSITITRSPGTVSSANLRPLPLSASGDATTGLLATSQAPDTSTDSLWYPAELLELVNLVHELPRNGRDLPLRTLLKSNHPLIRRHFCSRLGTLKNTSDLLIYYGDTHLFDDKWWTYLTRVSERPRHASAGAPVPRFQTA